MTSVRKATAEKSSNKTRKRKPDYKAESSKEFLLKVIGDKKIFMDLLRKKTLDALNKSKKRELGN